MDLISYLTQSQQAAVQEINLAYLKLAREIAAHRVGREVLGLASNPDLCKRISELTNVDANRLARCGQPLVGLRISVRILNMLVEAERSQNVDAYAYLATKSDKADVAEPLRAD